MSVYAHLSLSVDHYELYVTNKSTEDDLNDDEISSASEWKIHLEPCIDLANLLYCKSDIAQAKLSSIAINSLPLCYSKSEKINVYVNLPASLGTCNQYYNTENIQDFNKIPYIIQLEDIITNVPSEAVEYLDDKLNLPSFHFLLRSTLRIILDTQVFIENHYPKLSQNDLKLLHYYLDISIFSRHIISKQLCTLTSTTLDLDDHIEFKNKKGLSKTTETEWLDESSSLRPIEDRPQPGFGGNSINLSVFNDVNFKAAYNSHDSPKNMIETETLRWLNDMMIIDTEDEDHANEPLTDKSRKTLEAIIEANKNLVLLAEKTRDVLNALEKHIKPSASVKAQDELIKLTLNHRTRKLKCTINSKPFFSSEVGVSLTIILPEHCSHVLGANGKNVKVKLGPISYHDQNTMPTTLISNHVQHSSQMLAFPVRPIPRVIHLVSDLCQNLKRDFWLRDTKYENCHLLSSITLDESHIETGFIHIVNPDAHNHRLNNSKLLLSQFNVHLIDDQFQKILFQQKTYVSLQIILSPYVSP